MTQLKAVESHAKNQKNRYNRSSIKVPLSENDSLNMLTVKSLLLNLKLPIMNDILSTVTKVGEWVGLTSHPTHGTVFPGNAHTHNNGTERKTEQKQL